MKKRLFFSFLFVVILGIVYFSYRSFVIDEIQEELGKLKITTPLISIAYFIQEVGGDKVEVISLLPADQDYHTLELSPSQVSAIHKSEAFFTIGTGEEAPLEEKLKGSSVPVFNISKGVILIPYQEEEHSHEEGHHHHDAHSMDPHLWLSISNMSLLSQNIAFWLSELDPENQEFYQSNLESLQVRLQSLWQNIDEVLSPYKDSQIVVMHEAYGYFLEPFHIKQISLESFQRETSFKQLTTALEQSKGSTTHFLFVQPQYNPEQVKRIAQELKLELILFNPIFKDPFKEIPDVLLLIQGSQES